MRDLTGKPAGKRNQDKTGMIDETARKDTYTNDSRYNRGLRRIRRAGYRECRDEDDVKYYCMCAGFSGNGEEMWQ